MKENYLVLVGIGCLISVMPFLVHAIPPLLLSAKEPDKSFKNISERVVLETGDSHLLRTHSWVSNAIELEMMSTTKSPSDSDTSRDHQTKVAAPNISGYHEVQGNTSPSVDGLIRLFPGAAFPPATFIQSRTSHSMRAGSERSDGIKIRRRTTGGATSSRAVQSRYERVEETTDSWPVNPWGGVDFLKPPKAKKPKRSRTLGPTFHPSVTGYFTTIYWWYPVLTDNPNWKYIPDRVGVTKVCRGKSTLYNVPIVYDWLQIRIRNNSLLKRPFFWQLRREMYDFGLSEACHTNDTREWSDYINCAIMRNMRMDYMVPKYPLHQVAYFHPRYHGSTVHPQGHVSTHGPGWGGGK